jgi:hypothetical protein
MPAAARADRLAHIEGTDLAWSRRPGGTGGLTTLVDRQAGVIVAISYWDEPLHSSEAALTQARKDAAAAAGGDLVVERYEVAIGERQSVPAPGAVAPIARVQIEPTRIADGIAFIRTEVLPALRTVAGFRAAELLSDRSSGGGVFVTAWDDEEGGARSDSVLDELHDQAVGAKFPRTETYAVVHAAEQLG